LRIHDRLEKWVRLGHDTTRTASYARSTGENDEEEDA
jgi:hypothetical protein